MPQIEIPSFPGSSTSPADGISANVPTVLPGPESPEVLPCSLPEFVPGEASPPSSLLVNGHEVVPRKCSTVSVLYLFAGKQRQGDLRSHLEILCTNSNVTLTLTELDIQRKPEDDLTSEEMWDKLINSIRLKKWTVVILSPPCETFSRARCNNNGPPPLRSKRYPWGFPWLQGQDKKKVDEGNFFIRKSIEAIQVVRQVGSFYLLEHPEDLGKHRTGKLAKRNSFPASIWQLDGILAFANDGDFYGALFQCYLGADLSGPTRIIGNLKGLDQWVRHQGPPTFKDDGEYLGPLPAYCGHNIAL